jgi:DNA-binding transcriptional MocR family regulator
MVFFPCNCICFRMPDAGNIDPMDSLPLYRRLATHYRDAIEAGSLQPGERMPSLRSLMRLHDISLSTALQLCRTLESDGWAEARERSGYFVRRPQRCTSRRWTSPRPCAAGPGALRGHARAGGQLRGPAPRGTT